MSQNASLLFLYLKAGLCLKWSKTGFSCLDSKISLVAPLVKCLSFFFVSEQSRLALEELTISRSQPMKQVTWTIY